MFKLGRMEKQMSALFRFRILSGVAGLLLLSSCSSFHSRWKAAATTPPPHDDIVGRWEGSWRSDVNGHNGRLRCLVTKVSDQQYRAWYHAKYRKIFSFSYAVPLQVTVDGLAHTFQGQADLGWYAGGLYQYEGCATPTNFFSTYQSKYDHGIFQMARPEPAP
jgi:hypothetical protein